MEELNRCKSEKSRLEKTMFIINDSDGIIHREFVPPVQTVTVVFHLGVTKRLLSCIRLRGRKSVKMEVGVCGLLMFLIFRNWLPISY